MYHVVSHFSLTGANDPNLFFSIHTLPGPAIAFKIAIFHSLATTNQTLSNGDVQLTSSCDVYSKTAKNPYSNNDVNKMILQSATCTDFIIKTETLKVKLNSLLCVTN